MKTITITNGNFFDENGFPYTPLDGQKHSGFPMFQNIKNIDNNLVEIGMRHIQEIEVGDIIKHSTKEKLLFYKVEEIIESRPARNQQDYKGPENTFFKLKCSLL